MIPIAVTMLIAIFIILITTKEGAEGVGLAGPSFLVAAFVIFLTTWLVYFIIF